MIFGLLFITKEIFNIHQDMIEQLVDEVMKSISYFEV